MTWVDILLGALFVVPISWIAAVIVRSVIANRRRSNIVAVDESSTAHHKAVFDGRNSQDGMRVLRGVAFLGGLLCLVWIVFAPEPWRDSFNYSNKYNIREDSVHFQPKPKDCDWGHAPIGDKACHYKKQVLLGIARNTAQGQYMDEETYKKAVTGKGLYDSPAPIVTDVYVDWVKVED